MPRSEHSTLTTPESRSIGRRGPELGIRYVPDRAPLSGADPLCIAALGDLRTVRPGWPGPTPEHHRHFRAGLKGGFRWAMGAGMTGPETRRRPSA